MKGAANNYVNNACDIQHFLLPFLWMRPWLQRTNDHYFPSLLQYRATVRIENRLSEMLERVNTALKSIILLQNKFKNNEDRGRIAC